MWPLLVFLASSPHPMKALPARMVPEKIWVMAFQSKMPELRAYAASMLAQTGTENQIAEVLFPALFKDPNYLLRWRIIDGVTARCGEKGSKIPNLLSEAIIRTRDKESVGWGMVAFARIGGPAIPVLLKRLRDEDAEVCWSAAWALGEIKDDAVLPALREWIRQEKSPSLQWGIRALGNLGPKARTEAPLLTKVSANSGSAVRRETAIALGKIRAGDQQSLSWLVRHLNDNDSEVRDLATWALQQLPEH